MRYAAYGSNLHPLRLAERVTSAKFLGTQFLPHWSLHFHKRSMDESGKCNILPVGSGVYIVIFDLLPEDKNRLDIIEGLGYGYSETTVSTPDFGDCITYVAEHSHIDDLLRPYDWYKELVLLGAGAHEFPDDYLNQIRAIQALVDPDPIRRAEQWKTVEKIIDAN